MKKYQLKGDNGSELELIMDTDNIDKIIYEIRYPIHPRIGSTTKLSIWMDGKVLD